MRFDVSRGDADPPRHGEGVRRRFLLPSAAALGATAIAPAFGQQKPVFLHYTQEQLDQSKPDSEPSQRLYALMKI